MACGLGAIVLVFMIVKHNVEKSALEIDLLGEDLQRLQIKEKSLKDAIAALDTKTADEAARISTSQKQIASIAAEISKTSDVLSRKKKELSSIKKTIKNAPKAKKDDVVKDDKGGEENYVMGLKVEGNRIALLIDSSSSMTDEKLIDVIRRKNSSDVKKKKGPKWQRTKRVARWLLARLPKQGSVSVVTFNRKAKILGGAKWVNNRDPNALKILFNELDNLIPTGSTNLQIGLDKIATLRPSDVYIITDGLPTEGESNYRSLNPFASCGSLLGVSTNISGECRVKLFRQTISESGPRLSAKVNVILLPLEGDPEAAPELWRWTALTGGLLISPAVNWP